MTGGPRLAFAVGLAVSAATASAQTARVGAEADPGGVVIGRICVDLDRDGRCRAEEPGIAGARIRLDDGRTTVADEDGRFHAVELAARTVLRDRSVYGAHAVAVEGLGLSRRFELGPGGVAAVELAVTVQDAESPVGGVRGRGAVPPRVEGDRVVWSLAGTAPPGAIVRVGGSEAVAGQDGSWSAAIGFGEGSHVVGIAIADGRGAVALWRVSLDVVRPGSGAIRIYPGAPVLLAAMSVKDGGAGALVMGRVSPGVALRIGDQGVRASTDGRFGAWVPRGEGPLRAAATFAGAASEATLRDDVGDVPFRGLVLGEVELQLGGAAGFLASGRLAASTSGRWRGWRVDAGVDLDDRDRDPIDLSSPRDALARALSLDPLRTFTETGDGARVEDPNPGRGRLWARVDAQGLAVRLGDARTVLTEGELGLHDRAFFGGRADVERTVGPVRLGAALVGGRVGADAMGLAAGVPCQDLLLATGGSLLYLSHRQVVAGSEAVRVEWRDPLTRLPLGSRRLVRGRDYDLDAAGGRLLLAAPLSTTAPGAALLGGDPFAGAEAWVRVDYLRGVVGAGRDERGVAGGELRAAYGPVALAAGGVSEVRPGVDWELVRARARLDLGAPLRASLEVAQSRGELFDAAGARSTSLDGGFQFAAPGGGGEGEARAFHAAVEGRAGPGRWRGWWRERPAGYSDGSFEERTAARERGAIVDGAFGAVGLRLAWAERRGADPVDPAGTTRRDVGRATAAATLDAGPVDVSVEALHERLTLPTSGAQSAAGLRATWTLSRALVLEAGHLQAFAGSGEHVSATFTSAGAALRTKEGTLELRAGWGPELGPRLLVGGERRGADEALYGRFSVDPHLAGTSEGAASAVGGRQRVGGATFFTEERVAREPLGLVAGRVVGARVEPSEGLTLSLSGERGERLRLDGSSAVRGVGAIGASWARGPVRVDGRAELRTEGKGEQWVAGAGAEWRVSSRLALGARALLADGEISGQRARGGDGWLTAAWRAEAVSLLARLGRVKDDREGLVDRDATVAGLALTTRVARRGSIGVAVDAVRQRVAGASDDRIAGSARAALDLVGSLDLALEYARRGSLDGRSLGDLDAVRAEVGLTAGEVRLALGYTLVGFNGSGIDPEDERDGRVYLRAVVVR